MVFHDVPIGELWLPWYVYRDDPSRPVGAELAMVLHLAQQVRVRDLRDPQIRAAMGQRDLNEPDNSTHIQRIEALRRRYEGVRTVAILPVLQVNEGWVLLDGCHRACALHDLDPNAVADLIQPPHLGVEVLDPRPRQAEPA
jgi:hypothetical protein